MAIHNVGAGQIATHNHTLAAGVVDTVSFTDDPDVVEILSDGAAEIYVTIDGSTPTVGGANTYPLPAAPCARKIRHGGAHAVKLISTGTPTYSVAVTSGDPGLSLIPVGSGSGAILPWATATAYIAGQPVTNGGHTYTANDAHTAGATFAGDLAAHWTLLPVAVADVTGAAPLASPAFTGNPTAPTPAPGDNDTSIATSAFVKAALDALVASAPGTLDTLDELAAALGDDANFAATITTALAAKATEATRAASGKGFVNHGATAGTARPTGYASVEWVGSVSPTNAVDGDTWVNTT